MKLQRAPLILLLAFFCFAAFVEAVPFYLINRFNIVSCITATTVESPGQVRFLPCDQAQSSSQLWEYDSTSGHITLASDSRYALGVGALAAAKTSAINYDTKIVLIDVSIDQRVTHTWDFVASEGTGSSGYSDILNRVLSRVIWAPFTTSGSVSSDEVWASARSSGYYKHFFVRSYSFPTLPPTLAPTLPPTKPATLPPTQVPATLPPTNAPPTSSPVPPTAEPTLAPTEAPLPPTLAPTDAPLPPTLAPTDAPLPPTLAPTNAPIPPTLAPTEAPLPPTLAPTDVPIAPSATPTPASTIAPTVAPTPAPCNSSVIFVQTQVSKWNNGGRTYTEWTVTLQNARDLYSALVAVNAFAGAKIIKILNVNLTAGSTNTYSFPISSYKNGVIPAGSTSVTFTYVTDSVNKATIRLVNNACDAGAFPSVCSIAVSSEVNRWKPRPNKAQVNEEVKFHILNNGTSLAAVSRIAFTFNDGAYLDKTYNLLPTSSPNEYICALSNIFPGQLSISCGYVVVAPNGKVPAATVTFLRTICIY